MLRKLIYLFLPLLAVGAIFYANLVWDNNRQVEPLSRAEINRSLASSIEWLEENEEEILNENNPMLWWMIGQSATLTKDRRLQVLFSKYESRYLNRRQNNLWLPLFVDNVWVPVRYEDIALYPYYNKYFIYAMTCDDELGRQPVIAAQNEPDFCEAYPLRPACVTHQLMGIRIMQRKNCGDQEKLESVVKVLQEKIGRQLTWDTRVVDVYLQRVLMLIESGAGDRVKPVWLRHVLDAQTEVGGWDGFEPIFLLPGGYSFGFSGRGIDVQKSMDNFHATAQGVFIMSLLSVRQVETVQ